jgi:hypothetical protein
LTASTGSLPQSFASDSDRSSAFPSSGTTRHNIFAKLLVSTFYTPTLTNQGSGPTASHPGNRNDYGQMFSPRNNMGYLSSLQGNQSCLQRNTEIADSFSAMRNQFYAIVRDWPQKDGMYLTSTTPYIGIRW